MKNRNMTSEVTLRVAGIHDVAPIARLISSLGYPTTVSAMRERLMAILDDASYATFVAELDDYVVGMIGCRISPIYERTGRAGHIMALAVEESAQRSGCGRALMEMAERWVQQQGGVEMVINSGNHRTGAHAFYRARGYEATGQRFIKFFIPT